MPECEGEGHLYAARLRVARLIRFAPAVLFLLSSHAAHAGDRVALGLKLGTLGFGVDVTGRITDRFSVRGTLNAADVDREYSSSGMDYDGRIQLGGFGAFVDMYPISGSFRISAGALKNRNAIELKGTSSVSREIGGTIYTPAQIGRIAGSLEFNDIVPYVGVGLGNPFGSERRVRFLLDAGLVYQGSGDVSLTQETGLIAVPDLRNEESEIEDDIKHYKVWPVIALGIAIRF